MIDGGHRAARRGNQRDGASLIRVTAADEDLQEKTLGRIRLVNTHLCALAADFFGVTIFVISPFIMADESIGLRLARMPRVAG